MSSRSLNSKTSFILKAALSRDSCGDMVYTDWWFHPLWKILFNWDYHSPCMDHGHMDLGQQTRTLFDPRSRLHIIGTESVHFHYFCTLYWLSVISHCLIALLFFLLLYLPVPVTKATHRPCGPYFCGTVSLHP